MAYKRGTKNNDRIHDDPYNSDLILAFGGDDLIFHGGGDDVIKAGWGDDIVISDTVSSFSFFGGKGEDILAMEGHRKDWMFFDEGGQTFMIHKGGGDVIYLENVEHVEFF